MTEEILFDVALVEDGKITWVTWWKAIEPVRAMRLAEREGTSHGCMSGLVRAGRGSVGQKVKVVTQDIAMPQYLFADGRKIKQKDKMVRVRLLEVDNS